jgi:Domain of unknown function (DUF1707)
MATDDPIRASDADREVVVATLREAYTAGRLDLDEFDERTTAAYESKTWGDLRRLTADLPSQPILGGDVPGRLFRAGVSPDARLPSHPSRASLPTPPARRRGSPFPFLIPLLVWIVLAMHNASGNGAAIVVALLVGTVVLMAAVRRRLSDLGST